MLELKFTSVMAMSRILAPYNRTMLELKYQLVNCFSCQRHTYNRTMLELKFQHNRHSKGSFTLL